MNKCTEYPPLHPTSITQKNGFHLVTRVNYDWDAVCGKCGNQFFIHDHFESYNNFIIRRQSKENRHNGN